MIKHKPIPAKDLNSEHKWSREDAVRHVGEDALVDFEFAMDRQRPFWKRVTRFFRGESKLGRRVGAIADIGMIFLPGGVQTGREAVQKIITKKEKPMKVLEDKPVHKSSSMWGIGLFVVTAVLQILNVEVVNDPAFVESLYHVLYVISGSLGFTGLRRAIGRKKEKIEGDPENS